ncbi:hydroxyacid dehydrogenase [Sulfitobacter sp. D35]|uniref:2-hydroxyacid dehydrogenase n=1 Tax=Sulfitobacter sp. D35 TaxID=3083252 RepID=UPI00296F85EF|nr:hydroxyacid dehydrogenase [Sulfitobacter sp. D35]MDW4498927.1 hydroxyacid dehydrogenase [Sulfitobacter sp. D35]
MSAPVIFSTHPLHPSVTDALTALGDYRVASAPTPDAISEQSAGARVIVVRAPIPEDVVAREDGLQAMVRHGAGLDMIPVAAATGRGILVANVPGVNAVTVAEHAIWSAMALLRRYPRVDKDLRLHGWTEARAHSDHGRELSGKTIGIVGMGNVGTAVSRIARHGFGMSVLYHTRRPDAVEEGIAAMSLDALLAQSDVVVLCCPLTAETKGLIHAGRIAKMKPGAILINVARGPVVVEKALVEALCDGRLGGAAIDVFDRQPLPHSHALLGLPNVILTPHMAGITEESMLRMGEGVVSEVERILRGQLPKNLVNPDAVDLYRQRFGA